MPLLFLGGGRNRKGLTPLSKVRLDKGYDLYKQEKAGKLFALGGHYSTYTEDAIRYSDTGAQLRRDYLISKGANGSDIVMVEDGRDTIYEAFSCRKKIRELGLGSFILVTSEKHMPRALYVFRRIFGAGLRVHGGPDTWAITGDILLDSEETAYLELWRELFENLPSDIPDPVSWKQWYRDNIAYYTRHKKIHDRFHPPGGIESQAYTGRSQ